MRRVQGYLTDSGKFFEDESAAFEHDREAKLKKLLEEFVQVHVPTAIIPEVTHRLTKPEALDMFVAMFRDFSFKFYPEVSACSSK